MPKKPIIVPIEIHIIEVHYEENKIAEVKYLMPANGNIYCKSVEDVIELLNIGKTSVFVKDSYGLTEVDKRDSPTPHLRTIKDGKETNNLSKLTRY